MHAVAKDTTLLPLEATQLAVSAGLASENVTAMFSDQEWFKLEDLVFKDFNIASVFAGQSLELPKHIWVAKEAKATMVLAVSHTAILEMMQAEKEICKQYSVVD